MQRNDFKILILDDDPILGQAMMESLKISGYKVVLCSNSEKAQNELANTTINGCIVDCMLPKMNGVDFVLKMNSSKMEQIPKIFISGIYRDQFFIKEAIKKTAAVDFLIKPFDIQQLVTIFDKQFNIDNEAHDDSLIKNFLIGSFTTIKGNKLIHGFDLPIVYSCLSENDFTGYLNIINNEGISNTISFSKGEISLIDIKEGDTCFLNILVEKGFVFQCDIEIVMEMPSNKSIGERLVDANILSPHTISIALKEQLSILLSKTIQNVNLTITVIETDVPFAEISLNKKDIESYLYDWITTKIPSNWLKNFYTSWLDNKIRKCNKFSIRNPLFKQPLFTRSNFEFEKLEDGTTIHKILHNHPNDEEDLYWAIHLLFLNRLIALELADAKNNINEKCAKLNKILQIINETKVN